MGIAVICIGFYAARWSYEYGNHKFKRFCLFNILFFDFRLIEWDVHVFTPLCIRSLRVTSTPVLAVMVVALSPIDQQKQIAGLGWKPVLGPVLFPASHGINILGCQLPCSSWNRCPNMFLKMVSNHSCSWCQSEERKIQEDYLFYDIDRF